MSAGLVGSRQPLPHLCSDEFVVLVEFACFVISASTFPFKSTQIDSQQPGSLRRGLLLQSVRGHPSPAHGPPAPAPLSRLLGLGGHAGRTRTQASAPAVCEGGAHGSERGGDSRVLLLSEQAGTLLAWGPCHIAPRCVTHFSFITSVGNEKMPLF